MICGQRFALQTADFDQCCKSNVVRVFHRFQPVSDQDPVLVHQLHDITDCGERCHLKEILWCFSHQCLHELQCNHRSADPFEGITAIRLLRINHRRCRRQDIRSPVRVILVGHLMMIRNHHRQPQAVRQIHLPISRNPVITCQDRVHTVLMCLLDQMIVQSVSVLNAVGNHHIRICTQQHKPF